MPNYVIPKPVKRGFPGILGTLILRLTHRLWNRQISRILCRAYEDRVITVSQLYLLTSVFDPTQRHRVYGPNRDRGFLKPFNPEQDS